MKAKATIRGAIAAMATLGLLLGSSGTGWAESGKENPCDPAKGTYICDGTEKQPVEDDVAMTGDDGVSLSPKMPKTGV